MSHYLLNPVRCRAGRWGGCEAGRGQVAARKRRAFSLVEVLVTLTIGSLLVMSAVSATRALTGARASVDRRVERVSEARRAMEAIVAALRQVRRDPLGPEKPLVVGVSGGRNAGRDSINLQVISDRRARRDAIEADQHEVGFFLSEQKSDGRMPVLLRRRDHALDDHPDEGGVVMPVAEGIVSLSFEYLSGEQWYPEWPATEPRPPEAVRVTVVAATPPPKDSRLAPDTTVFSTIVPIRTNLPEGSQGQDNNAGSNSGRAER